MKGVTYSPVSGSMIVTGSPAQSTTIELDGKEHMEDEQVRERDRKKARICQKHNFELIRVDNTYARRYHYMKDILIRYFKNV